MARNALLADAEGGNFILPPKTLKETVRAAIVCFGKDAVKAEVQKQTKPRRGRTSEPDWMELGEVIIADAKEWLEGGDPFKKRTNYRVAQDFANKHPGQSPISTHKRIARKLKEKPYDRKWFMLVNAEVLGEKEYPHAAYIRTLEELCRVHSCPAWGWAKGLELTLSYIQIYTENWGNPPPDHMTFAEIREKAFSLNALAAQARQLGLLGALSNNETDKQD